MASNKYKKQTYDYLSEPAGKVPRRTQYRRRRRETMLSSDANVATVNTEQDNEIESESNVEFNTPIYERLVEEAVMTGNGCVYVDTEVVENDSASSNAEVDDLYDITSLMESIMQIKMDDMYEAEEDLEFQFDLNIEGSKFQKNNYDGEELLFPGSRMKVQELILLLLTLNSSCHIPFTVLKLIMKMIELVCPEDNRCKTSMKGIYDFIGSLDLPLRKHFYCSQCFFYLGTTEEAKPEVPCPCCKHTSRGHFIDVQMLGELKKTLERLWKYTGHRFDRNAGEGIADVYDGSVYQKHFSSEDGFLRNPNNISLMGFTDGVSIFKSSGFSVWPVYLTINELPPHLRFRRENGVFAGLWFGKTKPYFNTFFKPFVETIWDLYNNGIQLSTIEGSVFNSKVLLLQMTCDAPAKCLFQNFKQFNGKYGCPYCLHPGESCTSEGRGRSHIYDYREKSTCARRTHEDTVAHAEKAHQNKMDGKTQFDEFGVKGLSWALYMPKFDVIESVCLDYMHAALLGVVKQLMTLWFSSTFKTKAWSCVDRLDEVQNRLLHIKPTNSISRVPRSIDDLKHWKASEFRAWILFYGHVCLYEVLPGDYYQHFLLLVESLWILLQEKIEKHEIDQADRNLNYFCFQVETLYEQRTLTFNMHQLLHLPESVVRHGPLWTHSCFYFEDYNGQLRRFFSGTQNIENQVLRTVSVVQALPEIAKTLDANSEIEQLYSSLKGTKPVLRAVEKIDDERVAVGRMKSITLKDLDENVHAVLTERFPNFNGDINQFQRLLINGEMLHSHIYQRVAQRNSFTIVYNDTDFAQVLMYLCLSGGCICDMSILNLCTCTRESMYCAVILPLPVVNVDIVTDSLTGLKMKHTEIVQKPSHQYVDIICVKNIKEKVLYADFEDNKDFAFITKFPNHIEKD